MLFNIWIFKTFAYVNHKLYVYIGYTYGNTKDEAYANFRKFLYEDEFHDNEFINKTFENDKIRKTRFNIYLFMKEYDKLYYDRQEIVSKYLYYEPYFMNKSDFYAAIRIYKTVDDNEYRRLNKTIICEQRETTYSDFNDTYGNLSPETVNKMYERYYELYENTDFLKNQDEINTNMEDDNEKKDSFDYLSEFANLSPIYKISDEFESIPL